MGFLMYFYAFKGTKDYHIWLKHVATYTVMPHITMFRSTTDHIHDGGPIILQYHCVTIAYNIQYSNMLYRFVA